MPPLARLFLFLGILFLLVGGLMALLPRLNLPLGRLPGDIRIEREHFSFYFPIASSILLSVLLTILLNLLARLWRR